MFIVELYTNYIWGIFKVKTDVLNLQGLTLEVSQETKTASFHRTFIGQGVENQESVLEEIATQYDNNFEDDRLAITPDTASEINLLDIEGPEVSHECVPEKYKDLIPEGFKIQLVHQVQDYPGHNVFKSKDHKNMTIYDPLTQKDYLAGIYVKYFSKFVWKLLKVL